MERKKLIADLVSIKIHYHFGIGHRSVPPKFEEWLCKTVSKLDNAKLAQEARAAGIKIKSKDII